MKKVLFVLLFIIINAVSAKAQLYAGFKGGVNFTSLSDNKNPRPGTKEPFKLGFNGGAAGQLDLSRFVALYADLGYATKGNIIRQKEGDGFRKYNYHYIQLAVMPRFMLDKDRIRYYVNAGPTLGWLIAGSFNHSGTKGPIKFVDSEEYMPRIKDLQFLKDNTNRLEASLSGGGGLLIALGKGELSFDLRYDWGLVNIREDYDANANKIKNKNSAIAISLGYMIPININ